MLKKKAKIRKRLARIVLAALLCTGGMHGLAAPSVAEAAVTITVSNITGNTATGDITVTADPAGSMLGKYDSEIGVFMVGPDPAITGISEINIMGSGTPAFVYGAKADPADAGSHRVTVSGASTILGGVYANYQEGAAANNNTLIIENGASITGNETPFIPALVVAGTSETGGASGNRVIIRNATVGKEELDNGTVRSGMATSGNAAGNSVTVEGGATRIYGEVYGGDADDGNATGNEVNISNGEIHFNPTLGSDLENTDLVKPFTVVGGAAGNGEATGNRVNISDGIVGAEGAQDGQVVGGYASKTVSGNTVTIKGGTILNGAYGGYSESGAVSNNSLTIDGGSVYADTEWVKEPPGSYNWVGIPSLTGGFSESGAVSENTVTINKGTLTGSYPTVYGGYSRTNNASKNIVTVNGGVNVNYVYGGESYGATAESNEVYIKAGADVFFVTGGSSLSGDAKNNVVEISGGKVGVVYGGSADAGLLADGGTGEASGNRVTIDGSDTVVSGGTWEPGVYGGFACGAGSVADNQVEIKNGTVATDVYGGYCEGSGAVTNNTVTIAGGTALNGAYGGYSQSGAATGNALNIEGGTVYAGVNWRNEDDAAGYDSVNLAGGFAEEGVASENTVTVNGGEFTGGEGTLTAVAGGFSQDSDAVKNKAVVNGGTNLHDVYGGASENGNAENNEVYINTGANVSAAIGGTTDNGSATGNIVTVSGGTLDRENGITQTFGGYAGSYSDNGAAGAVTVNNNTVTVSGGTFGPDADVTFISGGDAESYSDNGAAGAVTAINNTVTVSGGTFGGDNGYTELLGGYAWSYSDNGTAGAATANNNTVTVSGGTFGSEDTKTEIYGGYAESNAANGTAGAATANNNTVTISGSPVFKGSVSILGGEADCETTEAYSETTEEACNNTVTILTPVTVYGLCGGLVWHDGTSTGNTLNIAAKNVTTTKAVFFQNMNFYLPSDIANGDTMLTIKGFKEEETGEITGNDLTGVTFGVAAQTGANLAVGDTVNLVVGEQGLVTDDTLKTTTSMTVPEDIATDTNYELSISKKDANTIMAAVTGRKISPNEERSKSPAETRMAVATQVNAGADLLAGQGMSNAADAAASEQAGRAGAAAQRTGGYAPFAAVGVSSLRAQSGSHVDTKGIGLALGFARELKNKSGKLLVGPVLEYGHGRYDSYQDDGSKADGKSHYWGVGIIAKQTNNNGLYYEGSLRVGRASSDYNRNNGDRMNYDSDATYWGVHMGIGKVQDIGHNNTLDYYGKYFYSHTGGDTTTMHTTLFGDVETRFDSVDSHRLRVGARLTHAVNEKNKIYGGLAYQYEFNGDARVTYNGVGNAPSPSVKGSSGMLELGWQVKPGRSPMVIDLGVTGWAGKQRGITANLQANWTF